MRQNDLHRIAIDDVLARLLHRFLEALLRKLGCKVLLAYRLLTRSGAGIELNRSQPGLEIIELLLTLLPGLV